jgi:hypothetical protein
VEQVTRPESRLCRPRGRKTTAVKGRELDRNHGEAPRGGRIIASDSPSRTRDSMISRDAPGLRDRSGSSGPRFPCLWPPGRPNPALTPAHSAGRPPGDEPRIAPDDPGRRRAPGRAADRSRSRIRQDLSGVSPCTSSPHGGPDKTPAAPSGTESRFCAWNRKSTCLDSCHWTFPRPDPRVPGSPSEPIKVRSSCLKSRRPCVVVGVPELFPHPRSAVPSTPQPTGIVKGVSRDDSFPSSRGVCRHGPRRNGSGRCRSGCV